MSTLIRVTLIVLPWALLGASIICLALGLSWQHLTDADTVNGAYLVASVLLAVLAFVVLCVREMPEKKEEKEQARAEMVQTRSRTQSAKIPLVPVA